MNFLINGKKVFWIFMKGKFCQKANCTKKLKKLYSGLKFSSILNTWWLNFILSKKLNIILISLKNYALKLVPRLRRNRMNNVPVNVVWIKSVRHSGKHSVIALNDLYLMDSDKIVQCNGNYRLYIALVECFSDFDVGYFLDLKLLLFFILFNFRSWLLSE